MKLIQINDEKSRREFIDKGYTLPEYDRDRLRQQTRKAPVWIHFGTGNIFRAFPAAVLDGLLNEGAYDKGIIAVEGFDYEIIDRAYKPFDDLSLAVTLKSDGAVKKRIIGSVTDSLTADFNRRDDLETLKNLFAAPSLQVISFTITEKGYSVRKDSDKEHFPVDIMGKVTSLLYERFLAGAFPITMLSMDNCSHNGDRLKEAVLFYADSMAGQGLYDRAFTDYLRDEDKVSFPLTMIDKITPRPDEAVVDILRRDGFEDTDIIITDKNTYTAAFVNAEETQYLVIEDRFPNGRPPLEKQGVYFTDRDTGDKAEKMKVCTCLNPLHTALAIFGCLLSYDLIWKEMQDEDLASFVRNMAYSEGMPVVTDPGIISPEAFADEVLNRRLVNPFMPDTPQRIACDTSQKLPIRFGVTLKAYTKKGADLTKLRYIPTVLAGYLRYLLGVDDSGNDFTPSPDPLLDELAAVMRDFRGYKSATADALRPVLSREDVFGVDLYKAGLADMITDRFNEMNKRPGMVREVLKNMR